MSEQNPLDEPTAQSADADVTDVTGVLYEEEVIPQQGVLGMTLRELLIVGVWLVAFITSFFPLLIGGTNSVWTQGIQWLLPIGVPTVAVFLLVLRRFSPDGIRRVGSLGIDQFASVAFSVAAAYWLQYVWGLVSAMIDAPGVVSAWVPWVQLVASAALVVLTVAAPLFPRLREDFVGRLETLAHRAADPARPVAARPRPDASPDDKRVDAGSTSVLPVFSNSEEPPTAERPAAPGPETSTVAENWPAAGPVSTDETEQADARPRGEEGVSADDTSAWISSADAGEPAVHETDGFGFLDLDDTHEAAPDRDADEPFAASETLEPFEADDEPEPFAGEEASEPFAAESDDVLSDASMTAASADDDAADAPFAVAPPAYTPAPVAQPFWALAPTERDVLDETGAPIFRIGPTAWALVIEDRGGAYVVRHDDGRIGYLHDIADVTKG